MRSDKEAYLWEELEKLSTGQLEELLREELGKDSNADADRVRLLLRVLDNRKDEYTFEDDASVQAACDKYRANHKQSKKKWRAKAAVAAVIVMLLLLVIPQAAQADSFFDMFARWTEDVFALFNSSGPVIEEPEYVFRTDNPGLQQAYDEVTAQGVTDPVVPMWMPEGYELDTCETIDTPLETYVHTRLKCGESEAILDIVIYDGGSAPEYYKGVEEVVIREINGISHYIMHNKNRMIAVWYRDNVECFLSVDCQEDVLYEILKSIYMTEAE